MVHHIRNLAERAGAPDESGLSETPDAKYRIFCDATSGLIHSITQGFWTSVDADSYFRDLGAEIETARRHHGRARVLVDRRGSPVQSPDVALRMRQANRDLYRPEDRLAIIVDSNLFIMQIRRTISHAGTRAFLSRKAALEWLRGNS